jgi:signal recognition particle subunit SRP19
LKDYEHAVLWLDYFNRNLKRRQGRKVKRDLAVFDPTVQDLVEAARAAGLQFSEQEINSDARFPRRSFVKSGYIMVAKKEGIKKSQIIDEVANKLLRRSSQKSTKK